MEKYHVLEMIGEGSFGRVYKGRRKRSAQVRKEAAGGLLCGAGDRFLGAVGFQGPARALGLCTHSSVC